MRTEEVSLTMKAGLGYEVVDSGRGKSAMNVVWKVSTVVSRGECQAGRNWKRLETYAEPWELE